MSAQNWDGSQADVGMLNPAARREDFQRAPRPVQQKIEAVLRTCAEQHMSCRVEVVGIDLYIIVGRGLSSPMHWLEMFGAKPRA